ncbi:MAG: pitrilysin family protein [Rikenellaceae bacterium]
MTIRNLFRAFFFLSAALIPFSCKTKELKVNFDYEQYILNNGLKVILLEDHSDPLVALAVQYHVGSGREKSGKTGFAHLFEHLLFQRSENVPVNTYLQKISNMGGICNGSTNSDGTIYFEVVPRDALEKVLWMESDRMGYFINTVTQDGLEREIDIVSNEKRQSYDSKPYGQAAIITAKEMFPAGHPYSWTTIGDIADLRSATLEDVKRFYTDFYVPNNATLVLSGDYDKKLAKELIQKYFGEIKKGRSVKNPVIQPLIIDQTKKIVWEDPYALLPEIHINFPSVEDYNNDYYAVELFTSIFANSKNSPLYKIIVNEKKLASSVSAYNVAGEVAGYAQIAIRTYKNINLNEVYSSVEEAFERFEKEGVNDQELQKLKVMQEVNLYNRLSKIQFKSVMLAKGSMFAGNPDASFEDLKKYQAVTKEDIVAVYNKYFKNKPHFILSIVPKGKGGLAINGSVPAEIQEEKVKDQHMKFTGKIAVDNDCLRTKSSFDRSAEPPFLTNTPSIASPSVWSGKLKNGMSLLGITQNELPVTQINLRIKGGMLLDPENKPGLSYLNAKLMNEGTALKTPEEFESALGLLGARIFVSADKEETDISVSCLARNFKEVMALVEEMILQPRFDEASFARIKNQVKSYINQLSSDPKEIATAVTYKLLFGKESTVARRPWGTTESIDAITLDDIKAFYNSYITPSAASFNIAGATDQRTCKKALASLVKNWKEKEITIPVPIQDEPVGNFRIYFIDFPNAPQSMILVSKTAVPYNSPDYYPCLIANYALGSGSQGMLFDALRLQKGFTYGAYSKFYCGEYSNIFSAYSSVQASTTKEAVAIFKDLITNYESKYDEELLDRTKNSMIRSKASSFETLDALVSMLNNISSYNLPLDYVRQQEETIQKMTVEKVKKIIKNDLAPDKMIYVIVGDARTQLGPLNSTEAGKVVLVDKEGNPVQ